MPVTPAVALVRSTRRDGDVVVSSMGTAREWMALGPLHPRDLVLVPSAMGHATSIGLGLAHRATGTSRDRAHRRRLAPDEPRHARHHQRSRPGESRRRAVRQRSVRSHRRAADARFAHGARARGCGSISSRWRARADCAACFTGRRSKTGNTGSAKRSRPLAQRWSCSTWRPCPEVLVRAPQGRRRSAPGNSWPRWPRGARAAGAGVTPPAGSAPESSARRAAPGVRRSRPGHGGSTVPRMSVTRRFAP